MMFGQKQKRRHTENIFLLFYVSAMLLASGWLCISTFSTHRTVLIHDRDLVMQRRSTTIPVAVEIREPRWGSAEMDDRSRMFEVSKLMGRISLYAIGPAEEASKGALEGKVTYIDGTSLTFSLGDILNYEEYNYGGDSVAFDLGALRRILTEEMYTLGNLAGFFSSQHSISITHGGTTRVISSNSVELLRQAILSSRLLSSPTEIEYHIRNRDNPSYLLTIKRFGNINDVITVAFYDSDYAEVYDITGGNGLVMVLTGDFSAVCQTL